MKINYVEIKISDRGMNDLERSAGAYNTKL